MKTIITFALCFCLFTMSYSQDKKQETLKIEKLPEVVISPVKKDLSKSESIVINKMSPGYIIHYSSNIFDSLLWAIQSEEDAQQLKKELQHLIEILKIENAETSED